MLLSLALAACGGGGDDATSTPLTMTAPAGQTALPNGDASSVALAFTPITYTNAGAGPRTVRIQTVGAAKLIGEAAGGAFMRYQIGEAAPVVSPLTQASSSTEVAVPSGETMSARVGMSLSNATGAASLEWSSFTLTLTPL